MKKLLLLLIPLLFLVSCNEKSTVTEGPYVLSGKITEPITVTASKDRKVEIVLNGAEISCEGTAPISITEADSVVITLAEGSVNTLEVTSAFGEEDKANAAIYSKCDLILTGSGALTVINPYGHGIEAKDDLTIEGGSYTVTSSGHGFQANDSIYVTDGIFDITCDKDGFHSENEEDTEKGYLVIEGGSFNIVSAQDGISAAAYMTLDNGEYTITAGEGATVSEAPQKPEKFERPDMTQMPEGFEKPDMTQMPEGFERPDMTQMPEGTEIPQRGERVPGMNKGQGMRPQWNTEDSADTSTESMKGIKAGGVLTVNGGSFNISSADDCLHSNTDLKVLGGDFTLTSSDDAFHADANLSFADGNVRVIASYEALEGESIDIHGGVFVLKSTDDGLNAAGGADGSGFGFRGDFFGSSNSYINIAGGEILLDADGDGADSNGSLTVSGGALTVLGPLSGGDAPIDWQISGEISGGTVIAVGSSSMAMNFNSASQGSVFLALDGYVEAGKTVTLTDADGNPLMEKAMDKSFNCILISTPDMTENGSYTVTVDGTEYPVTLEGYTYSNKSGGFGGFGGGRGQRI